MEEVYNMEQQYKTQMKAFKTNNWFYTKVKCDLANTHPANQPSLVHNPIRRSTS